MSTFLFLQCGVQPTRALKADPSINSAWVTDLSPHLPQPAHLDGLDISFDASRPHEWLPPNVTQRHFDVKGDVPTELVECYDVVHIRNFVFILLDEEVLQTISNLAKLLSE